MKFSLAQDCQFELIKIVPPGIWRVPGCFSFFIVPASLWSALAFLKIVTAGSYLKSSSIFQGFFLYCSSESLKWSCVSKNSYSKYLKSSRMFQAFLLFQQVFEVLLRFKKIATASRWSSGLPIWLLSFTGFLEIVPAGVPRRIPSCQNRSGGVFNLAIGCSRFSEKLFRLVLEVFQGCPHFFKIILARFKLIWNVLAFFKIVTMGLKRL